MQTQQSRIQEMPVMQMQHARLREMQKTSTIVHLTRIAYIAPKDICEGQGARCNTRTSTSVIIDNERITPTVTLTARFEELNQDIRSSGDIRFSGGDLTVLYPLPEWSKRGFADALEVGRLVNEPLSRLQRRSINVELSQRHLGVEIKSVGEMERILRGLRLISVRDAP